MICFPSSLSTKIPIRATNFGPAHMLLLLLRACAAPQVLRCMWRLSFVQPVGHQHSAKQGAPLRQDTQQQEPPPCLLAALCPCQAASACCPCPLHSCWPGKGGEAVQQTRLWSGTVECVQAQAVGTQLLRKQALNTSQPQPTTTAAAAVLPALLVRPAAAAVTAA